VSLPDLSGRTALVTGASRGLGLGIATEFLRRGMRVAVCARTLPPLRDRESVLARSVDVSDERALESFADEAFEYLGRIDLWINNAGLLAPIGPLREQSLEAVRVHLETNLLAVFSGSRIFANHVRGREGEGTLINVSSGAAWNAYAGWSAYCAGKAGVERMTECLALEEADRGLRAYSVAPGVVNTDMQALLRSQKEEDFPSVGRFRELAEQARFNSPAFVAGQLLAIAFDPDARPAEVALRLPDEPPGSARE